MKRILFLLPCLAFAWVGEVPQALDRVFVPTGFDNNDTIQIVARGAFKNSCYQMGYLQSELDDEKMEITLSAMSYEYAGKCTDFAIPFHQVVHLGLIRQHGTYTIRDAVSKSTLGKLVVEKAEQSLSGTDSVLYAPLTDAYLYGEGRTLVLTGTAPSSCFKLQSVEFKVYDDVVVVLPIADYRGKQCTAGLFPFRQSIDIPKELPKTPFLLHVRSSGGQSVNKMVYLLGQ